MEYIKKMLLAVLGLGMAATQTQAQTSAPAFPGAEGHARYTTKGGRGGNIYHVTNLNDSGTGSFRDAVGTSNRIIVFDVSGYIDLKSEVVFKDNLTIAGQTAPGDGITIRYYTVRPGNNNIIRYVRFRRSQVKDVNDGADCTWQRQKSNIIFDHCSFSWSIDELASFYDNKNFTMQWCMLGEALNDPGHSKGAHSYGGIWGGKGASFHHNMICHVQNRAPRFNGARYGWTGGNDATYLNCVQAERVDFRNCVMYNWGNGNGCYGGPGGGNINIINNYYKAGPGTVQKTRVTQVSVANSGNADSKHPELYGLASRYYIEGNTVTAAGSSQQKNYDWKGVIYDSGLSDISGEKYIPDPNHYYGSKVTYVKNSSGVDCVRLRLEEPTTTGEVTTHTAENAYTKVLQYVGASFARDAVDARYAEEARTGTTTYTGETSQRAGIIDYVNDPSLSSSAISNYSNHANFPKLVSETRPADFDTDKDGMPDWWEDLNGLNKNSATDAKTYTLDSKKFYTNLEVYLNGIVEEQIKAENEDAITAVTEYYPAAKHATGIALPSVSEQEVVNVRYYSLDGKLLAAPQKGINVRKTTYANGIVSTDKVLAE